MAAVTDERVEAITLISAAPLPPIVCGVDDGYLVPLCALLASIAESHPDQNARPRVIVLHRELSAPGRDAILRCGERLHLDVRLRQVAARSGQYPVTGWVSDAVYLRLAIPEVIDDPVALYLDADTLVLRDLGPLLRHRLDGVPLAAVRDPQNPTVGTGLALPRCERLGVPRGREYFNSGVMLFDLAACAEDRTFERARRFLAEFPDEVVLWDQDAFNVAVDDRWRRLDSCWNTFAMSALMAEAGFVHYAESVLPLAELLAAESTAAVVHFAGPVKPWRPGFPSVPLRAVYHRFLALSGVR